jgi:hypothetical protein
MFSSALEANCPNLQEIGYLVSQCQNISLESWEENLTGEDEQDFLRFVRSMLHWRPEDRKTILLLETYFTYSSPLYINPKKVTIV